MSEFNFQIDPVAAPRMVQSDKWQKRPTVTKYFAFRDELKYLAYLNNLEKVPGALEAIIFSVPMPKSWSEKKRAESPGRSY